MADPHVDTPSEPSAARPQGEAKPGKPPARPEPARPEPASFSAAAEASPAMTGVKDLLAASRSLAASRREAAVTGADLWLRSFEPYYAFHNSLMGWFDEAWRDALNGLYPAEPSRAFSAAPWMGLPPVDVRETADAYLATVELPGLAETDIKVTIEGEMLYVRGCKTCEREDVSASYRLSERRFGRFERAFHLPPGLARDRVQTSLRDGVLTITVPREHAAPAAAPAPAAGAVRH